MAELSILFQPLTAGALALPNPIVMAPLTRRRAGQDRIPNALMREHYVQRSQAGLIITEATSISEQGLGWDQSPGIYNDAQTEGWRNVVEGVHAVGGKIVLQLWHVGRASHPDFQPDGQRPVSSSAVKPAGEIHTPQGKKPYVTPRALELDEIPGLIQDYVTATERAKAAGFDGVEIHSANGYLLDQFLRDGVNRRTDQYGGSLENRSRLLLDVVAAVVKAWSADRVGVRFSPLNPFNDITDSNPTQTFTYAAEKLNDFGLAYLHVMEPITADHMMYAPGEPVAPQIRKVFTGPLMLNGGYDAETEAAAIASGSADFISYGVPFIANPDLPERYRKGLPLNPPNFETFYTHGAEGYTDYPFVAAMD